MSSAAVMIILIPAPTGYGGVRNVAVSLPRIDCLVAEMPQKYFEPGDARPPARADDPQPAVLHPRQMSHSEARLTAKRRPRRTGWDAGGYRRHREQRDLAELAEMLGEPV